MKSFITVCFCMASLLQVPLAAALDHTHIDNHCYFDIIATTTYATSGFKDRTIPPGGSGEDNGYSHHALFDI